MCRKARARLPAKYTTIGTCADDKDIRVLLK